MAGCRAADDFVVIRARLAELQRQRDQAVRGEEEPRPKPLPPAARQALGGDQGSRDFQAVFASALLADRELAQRLCYQRQHQREHKDQRRRSK